MKKKGNISLLVLFVLIACSLLWIIAVQYTRHIAIQIDQIHGYYKAYYLAKWGSEIWLSLMQLRKEGYSWEIEDNSDFTKQNLHTGSHLSLKIQWSSNILSMWHPDDKTCSNPITISSWQSFILPLFIDQPEDDISDHFSEKKFYKNKSENLKEIKITNKENPWKINIWIVVSSWWEINKFLMFFTGAVFNWDDFFEKFVKNVDKNFEKIMYLSIKDWQTSNWQKSNLQNYLIIANKENRELSFCLNLLDWEKLALAKTYISSFWYIGDKTIWLETVYEQPIPSYLIDSDINI